VHEPGLWKLVPRPMRPGGAPPLHGSRLAQGWRHHRGRARSERATAHGDLRMADQQAGRTLHARGRAKGARGWRDDAPFHRAEVSGRTVKAEHAKRTKVSHFLRWLEAVGQFQCLTRTYLKIVLRG